jgi:uncharacterized protein (DUF362 family)
VQREKGGKLDMKDHEMDRREFIKKSVKCATYVTTGLALGDTWGGRVWAENPPDSVVAVGDPGPATKAAVAALGGMGRFVGHGDKVVIKPNMSFANPPEMATTTHPDVVRQLVSMCLNVGASKVLVLDNPLRGVEQCLERSGLKVACEFDQRSQVAGLADKRFFQEVPVPKGMNLKSTWVMKSVLESDVLISAPVAKSHSATGVSLAMKGMMGLIYDRHEFHRDMDLDTAIVDLCTLLVPKLTVIDASRILSTGGPGGPGKVLAMRKIITSANMVSADALAVTLGTWYGKKFKPRQVKHIMMAHERGLGRMDVENLVVKEVSA